MCVTIIKKNKSSSWNGVSGDMEKRLKGRKGRQKWCICILNKNLKILKVTSFKTAYLKPQQQTNSIRTYGSYYILKGVGSSLNVYVLLPHDEQKGLIFYTFIFSFANKGICALHTSY